MSTLVNILGLSVAIASSFLIFLWVQNEYSYDRVYPESENIYRLTAYNDQTVSDERIPYKLSDDLAARVPGIRSVTRIFPLTVFRPDITVDGKVFKESSAAYADGSWFDTFPADFVHGHPQEFSGPNSAVLSVSAAQKYFGTVDAVGKTLMFNGKSITVSGIVKDPPTNSSFRFDVLVNDQSREVNLLRREKMSLADAYQTFLKVSPGIDQTALIKNLNRLLPENFFTGNRLGLVALHDIHFEKGLDSIFIHRGDKNITMILLVVGIILLSVACINYVNLATVKISARLKEAGMKKLAGASRADLFLQFVVETAFVVLAASLIAIMITRLSLLIFNRITENTFTLSLTDPVIWTVLGGTFMVTLCLSSIYPAMLLSSFKPLAALRSNMVPSSGPGILQRSLVIVQFTVAVIMIAGTLVISRQVDFIRSTYSNQYRHGLFSFIFSASDPAKLEVVRQELLSNSSIRNVASFSGKNIIDRPNGWGGFDWIGRDRQKNYKLDFFYMGSNLNEFTQIEIKEGRWFNTDKSDEKNFIINEAALGEMELKGNVIGQRLSLDADTGVIIGVVKNFHYTSLHSRIGPLIIGTNPAYSNSFLVQPVPGREGEALADAEMVFNKFSPGSAFDYLFAADEYAKVYRTEQNAMSLILWFSGISILISCLGIYALAAFSTTRRTKEIGIRKVLGSTVTGIVALLSSGFLKLVLIAVAIALPLAWWSMNTWLQDFAYHIDISLWMFLSAGLIAVFIALLAVGFRTIKAAAANPVKSLRSE